MMDARYKFLDLGVVNAPYASAIKNIMAEVVDSGRYIGGPAVEKFERDLRHSLDVPDAYVVAVSTGLDALRLILRAYMEMGRLSPGDEVIVPSNTFIASVLAITDNGLVPRFVEPDTGTANLDSSLIERAITSRTKVLMPVHLYGRVAWDEDIKEIARRYNLIVVEDNAQAIGAKSTMKGLYGGSMAGDLGDAAGFSFYPTKNIGALGDAGAVMTRDAELARVVRALGNYGSEKQYHNIYAGLNCRMDPVQAAILSYKLGYLEEENGHRQRVAETYEREIANPAVIKPPFTNRGDCVWHQYVVRVEDRDAFREYLIERGVETGIHYPVPPHRQQCYREYSSLQLPVAERLAREVVSLPVSRCTSIEDAESIAKIINGYLS